MEFISWFLHKYLFHGPLWFIHKTHHNQTLHSSLELNDVFTLIFALTSVTLIFSGVFTNSMIHLNVGLGITLYGCIYFAIHDGIIHQRYGLWNKPSNIYLKQIQRAHQRHHAHSQKQPSEEYGLFFLIGWKYWREIILS